MHPMSRIPVLAFLVICAFFAVSAMADGLPGKGAGTVCDGDYSTTIEFDQCLGKELIRLQGKLQKLYNDALAKMPAESPFDVRKARGQLVKAETAWQTYVNENCAYVGGLQGGNNGWVTAFESQCLIRETQARIEFFMHLPTGG